MLADQNRWIIAEVGSVHDGSFGNACKLIELAAACGANAVKFQTHVAESETLRNAPSPSYFKAEPRFDYFRRTAFDKAQWHELIAVARANNVAFISSPFALEAVDLLVDVGVDALKIASGEVTNLPLLEHAARAALPVILSSGMSDWRELDQAVDALQPCSDLMVMQCTSAYPCPVERAGINVIGQIVQRYQLPVGFSDHTQGYSAAIAAAVLGATAIEKHITFSRGMYGSDAKFAAEPAEFTRYCAEVRDAWNMLANPVDKADLAPFVEMKQVFEKSIVTVAPVTKGTVLGRNLLGFKKPGTGIRADRVHELLGKRAVRDLPPDHILTKQDYE